MLRFRSLDGWRGIAAILVSLYHLNFLNHIYDWEFLRNSYLFVDFFFVLSGFVITHAYLNKLNNLSDTKDFILRRFIRLFPLHLFVLILFFILELIKLAFIQNGSWNIDEAPFAGHYSVPSLISNLLLFHSMGIHENLSWNYPSWSISVEFYTYILFAAVGLITLQSRKLTNLIYLVLIVVSFYIIYENTKNLNEATYSFGIFRCIVGFFLGSFCYQLFQARRSKILPSSTLIELLLIVAIYLFTVYFGKSKLSIFAPFLFFITVYVFSLEQGVISKFLKNNFLQNLGKWSYSIYMIHALIILIMGRCVTLIENTLDEKLTILHVLNDQTVELFYFSESFIMDLLTIIYLAILIFISSQTYKYIELKGTNIFRKIITRSDK